MCAKSLQSRPNLYDPMDCSMPGSSVYGILQARILEWVAISFCNTGPKYLLRPFGFRGKGKDRSRLIRGIN